MFYSIEVCSKFICLFESQEKRWDYFFNGGGKDVLTTLLNRNDKFTLPTSSIINPSKIQFDVILRTLPKGNIHIHTTNKHHSRLTTYRNKYITNESCQRVHFNFTTYVFIYLQAKRGVTDFIYQDWNDKDFFYFLYIFYCCKSSIF